MTSFITSIKRHFSLVAVFAILFTAFSPKISAQTSSTEKIIPLGFISVSSLNDLGSKLNAFGQIAKSKIAVDEVAEIFEGIQAFYEKLKSLKPVIKIEAPVSITLGYREKQLNILLKKATELMLLQKSQQEKYTKSHKDEDDQENNKELERLGQQAEKLQNEVIAQIDNTLALAIDLETGDSAKLLEMFNPIIESLNFGDSFKLKISFSQSRAQIHNGKTVIDSVALRKQLSSEKVDVSNPSGLFQFRFNAKEISRLIDQLLNSEFSATLSSGGGMGAIAIVGEYFSEFIRQYYNLSPAILGGYGDIIADNQFLAIELGFAGSIDDRIYLRLLEQRRLRSLDKIRQEGQVDLKITNPLLHFSFPADLKDTFDTLEFTRGDDIYLIRNLLVFMSMLTDVVLLNNTKYNFWKNFNSNADVYLHLNDRNDFEVTIAADPLDAKAFGSFLRQVAKRSASLCTFIGVQNCNVSSGEFDKKTDEETHIVLTARGRSVIMYTNKEVGLVTTDKNLIAKIRNQKKQAEFFRYQKIVPYREGENNSKEFPIVLNIDLPRFLKSFKENLDINDDIIVNIKDLIFFAKPVHNSRSSVWRLQLNFK